MVQENNINVLKWPAQSPDLNPIEHLWQHLKWQLNAYEVPPAGIHELWDRVQVVTKSPHFSPLFPPIFDTVPHAGGTQRPEDKGQLAAQWPERRRPDDRAENTGGTQRYQDDDSAVPKGTWGTETVVMPKEEAKTQEIGSEIND